MRNISDIYEEYKIIPTLQMHQLRVTAVAFMICESLSIHVDRESIIMACLFHDMGNVIKFDLIQTQSIFGLSDEEVEEARQTQKEFIERYGHDEHEATIAIARELSLSEKVVELAGENRFSYMCKHKDSDSLELKIMHYADGRVGPHGILSYEERMKDGGARYKNHKLSIEDKERQKLVDCGKEIEKQIFVHSIIKPEDITEESVVPLIETLKNYAI